jgi:hypothetical protein
VRENQKGGKKMGRWEYVPNWFIVLVFVIAAGFTLLNYLLTKGKVEHQQRKSNGTETKAYYYENPLKIMTKPVDIIDIQMNEAGQLRREFSRLKEMLISLFLPNYYVVFKGEDEGNHTSILIEKRRGKKSLLESKWDIAITYPNNIESFVMKGKKVSVDGINASFSYQDDFIEVSENRKDRTFHFSKNNLELARVTPIGKMPPRKIFIDGGNGELPLLLVAGIYEALKLYR